MHVLAESVQNLILEHQFAPQVPFFLERFVVMTPVAQAEPGSVLAPSRFRDVPTQARPVAVHRTTNAPRSGLRSLNFLMASFFASFECIPVPPPVVLACAAFCLAARTRHLFLDHTALALSVHIAHVYVGMNPSFPKGGLALWHERRVKELMRLDEELPLSRLAEECGLSVRHFARAFRQCTGVPPQKSC